MKKQQRLRAPPQTEAARPAAPARSIPVDKLVLLGLFFSFWAIYYLAIGVEKPNLYWYNFVFDADPARVLDDALQGQNPAVFARHPLFALTVGTLASLFGAVLEPPANVLAATSCFAALGVAASLVVFRRICGRLLPALLFSLLYGFAATTLVLASIPETFAINSAIIVTVFLMHRPEFGQPLRHTFRFVCNAIVAALAMGVAVPNIVYPALGFVSNLRKAQPDALRRLTVLLIFVAVTCGSLVLMGWAQQVAFPDKVTESQVLTAPFKAVGNDAYLRFDRPFVPAEAGKLLRGFVADNLVAPRAVIATGRVVDGPLTLIQYGGSTSALYLLALLALLGFAGMVLWRSKPGEALREHTIQLALVFIAYNLAFHYFYRANGQPFIFSVHTVFPLLVLLAELYQRSAFRFRTEWLAVATLLVMANNLAFLGFVRRALALPCEHQVGNVCLAWPGNREDPRFNKGVAEFVVSADYPFELGRVEYTQGRFEASIPYFQRALELGDRHLLTRLYFGAALIQANRLDDAVEHLKRSLAQFPSDPKVLLLLEDAERRRSTPPPGTPPAR